MFWKSIRTISKIRNRNKILLIYLKTLFKGNNITKTITGNLFYMLFCTAIILEFKKKGIIFIQKTYMINYKTTVEGINRSPAKNQLKCSTQQAYFPNSSVGLHVTAKTALQKLLTQHTN